MKIKPILAGLAALGLIFSLPACQKENESGDQGLEIRVEAQNKAFTIPVTGQDPVVTPGQTSSITWDSAMMWVSRITLEAVMNKENIENGNTVNYFWQGPERIDLFSSTEKLGDIGLTAGYYKKIGFEVIANKSDAGNEPVLYLSGTYTNSNGVSYPIVVDISDDLTLISQKNNVTIKRGLDNDLAGVIHVYLNKLFTGILPGNLEEITVNDGSILISQNSNRGLYNIIVSNLNKGRGTLIIDPTEDLNNSKEE